MKQLSASGASNLGASISMLALAVTAIVLRLIFRLHARQSLTLSDALIGLSLAFAIGNYALLINYIVHGPGPGTFSLTQILGNSDTGGLVWGRSLLQTLYPCEILYTAAISMAKLSILAFYHNIFGISITFKRFNLAMVVVVGLFWLLFTFLFLFQCHPIYKMWDALESANYCLSTTKVLFSFEFTNLFVDLAMLAMPPVMISKLKLPTDQKWSVSGILLLGGMVCIISMVRLAYIWNPSSSEFPKGLSEMQITSEIQLGVAIICACLPTYAPLLRFFRHKGKKKSAYGKTHQYELSSVKTAKKNKHMLDPNFADNSELIKKELVSLDRPYSSSPFGDTDGMDVLSSHSHHVECGEVPNLVN